LRLLLETIRNATITSSEDANKKNLSPSAVLALSTTSPPRPAPESPSSLAQQSPL
jgi:hypothetical protein